MCADGQFANAKVVSGVGKRLQMWQVVQLRARQRVCGHMDGRGGGGGGGGGGAGMGGA